jgi:lipopolysaccharide export system protein LptA
MKHQKKIPQKSNQGMESMGMQWHQHGVARTLAGMALAAWLAMSAGAVALAQTYEKDTQEPIEISSNTLDVDQVKNIAVFKGNVVAIQGEMRLRSDVMTVYYTRKDENTPKVEGESTQGAISKIVVNGNVVLATPEESAQGKDGLYEVDKKMLYLTGNVLLTRGKNILRGTRLDYNLVTGRSVLLGASGDLPNTTGGRVRGVFVPDDAKKK